MLTKSDISQIRIVVKEEIETQIKPVNGRLDKVETRLGNVESQIKTANKRLKKVEGLAKDTLSFLDRQNIDLDKRTKRIEHHLGLPQIV